MLSISQSKFFPLLANIKHINYCNAIQKTIQAATSPVKRTLHTPVMAKEVLEIFDPQKGQKFLDMTFGSGGHTKSLLSRSDEVTVYGLDRDATAYHLALELERDLPGQLVPLQGKFSDLQNILEEKGLSEIQFDGILIDCGCSSMQLDSKDRGFSLSRNGPLDMRMNQNPESSKSEPTVADILRHIDETSLARILKIYGEERQAKKIARAIIESRFLFNSLKTTKELAELVECACGFSFRKDKLQRQSHVATKTFQALRIFVNDELNELDYAMNFSHQYLKNGGKLVTVSFHSLEDRYIWNPL